MATRRKGVVGTVAHPLSPDQHLRDPRLVQFGFRVASGWLQARTSEHSGNGGRDRMRHSIGVRQSMASWSGVKRPVETVRRGLWPFQI